MDAIKKILSSALKPKQKQGALENGISRGTLRVEDLVEKYEKAKISDRGLIMEVLELVSSKEPSKVFLHLDFVIAQIAVEAPRIKWESSRIIANMAKNYPVECRPAIQPLLQNTKHDGTVVRWSAAKALCEIAKYTNNESTNLFEKIVDLERKEQNKGVKAIYTKAIKQIRERIGG